MENKIAKNKYKFNQLKVKQFFYQVAGMHRWFGQRTLFCGHVRWAQCNGFSSLLSPQSLSPENVSGINENLEFI